MQDATVQENIQEIQEDDSSWEAYTGSTDLSDSEEDDQQSFDEESRDEVRCYQSRKRPALS